MSSRTKSKAKVPDAKAQAPILKRKRAAEDEEDEDELGSDDDNNDDDEDEDESPKKSSRSSSSKKIVPKKAEAKKPAKKVESAKKAKVVEKKPAAKNGKKVVEEEDDDKESGSDDGSDNDDDDDNDGDNDSDDDDDEEEDEEEAPAKKSKAAPKKVVAKKLTKKQKEAAKKKKSKSKTVKKASESSSSSSASLPKTKKMRKVERLEEARKSFKWWEAPELPDGKNWYTLEHAGVSFAPNYEKHGIPMKYDGNILQLTEKQEEMASHYAALPDDGPQLGIPKTRVVFQKNFFNDFQATFPAGNIMKKFDKCDFTAIKDHLELQKSLRKAATDEEKAVKKAEKEELVLQFGYCLIDGRMERVGNYNMEPPGLFRGRGEHPRTGMAKSRCFSESVSLNMSQDSVPPKCLLPGHAWENIRHDPDVTWLCKWEENILGSTKYVMLAASSSFKGKSDTDKYQKAIRLKHCIADVRKDYTTKIKSKSLHDRQLGVAMWAIDILALRVGGEKGEDEADTVGCCSLRKEHLTFNKTPGSFEIELEFLGKDSMLYKQNINFAQYEDIGKLVYACLKTFVAGKKPEDQIFETVTPTLMNNNLTSLMKGLSAKVFRTFNASITLEKELPEASTLAGLSISEKLNLYNAANRQVAILCNHQKTVSKAAETMFENLNEKLQTMKDQREKIISWKELAKSKKANKIPLKEDDKERIEELTEKLKQAILKKENAKSNEDKLASAVAIEEAKANVKLDQARRFLEKHMFLKEPTLASLEARIDTWADNIRKLEVDIRNRDENKEVALGTSKINYMDPRISVAWCKRCEVPIDKVFAKTLRDKFNWAMAVPPTWKFE